MVKGRMLSFKVEATVILEAGDSYNVSKAGNVGHQYALCVIGAKSRRHAPNPDSTFDHAILLFGLTF